MKPTKRDKEELKLVNPMMIDTEEDLDKKKEKWNDIFYRCPEFTDTIIAIFENGGEDEINAVKELIDAICKYKNKEV